MNIAKLVLCEKCNYTGWRVDSLMDDIHGCGTCIKCGHRQSLKERVEPKHLYTPADVKKVREKLYQEQGGKDILTGLELAFKDSVTDHNHETQYVRGILHRQSNAVLGKIENLHTRYLGYWYPGTLPEFLRQAADYIERPDNELYIHPGWIKRVNIEFNKLNEAGKKTVLESLGQPTGSNGAERKKLFQKAVLTKKHTFQELKGLIERSKN